jgi:hypothetical protein
MPAVHREAIKKAIVNKLDVGPVPEGMHTFDHSVVLHVIGSASRAPDKLVKPTCDLPVLEILALAVAEAKIDGPKLLGLIRQAVADAAVENAPVKDYLETTKASMRQVQEELVSKMTLKPKAGAFTGAVEVKVMRVVKAK